MARQVSIIPCPIPHSFPEQLSLFLRRFAFDKAQIRREGDDLLRRQRRRDLRHRRPRSVQALAPLLEPTLEIVVGEPAEARNLADALRFGAVARLASGDVLVGNAVFKYSLALGDEFRSRRPSRPLAEALKNMRPDHARSTGRDARWRSTYT